MPSIQALSLLLSAALSLYINTASAQSCYYPDGSLSATDVPCPATGSGVASCCGPNSFCMNNGLCYYEGILSRASCTDKTWVSGACPAYCKAASPSSSISISPCSVSSSTFACGVNSSVCDSQSNTFVMTGGDSFLLRSSQVAALLGNAVTQAPAAASNGTGTYTIGAVIGVGAGAGVPLLIALVFIFILMRKNAALSKSASASAANGTKGLLARDDEAGGGAKSEFSFRPPTSVSPGYSTAAPSMVGPNGRKMSMVSTQSEAMSLRSVPSTVGGRTHVTSPVGGPQTPVHLGGFYDRHGNKRGMSNATTNSGQLTTFPPSVHNSPINRLPSSHYSGSVANGGLQQQQLRAGFASPKKEAFVEVSELEGSRRMTRYEMGEGRVSITESVRKGQVKEIVLSPR